jgi:hypothetical protein
MTDGKRVGMTSFASHHLIHNNRKIQKIVVSKEGDGAFAVVNVVDTLWKGLDDGKEFHWKGRACKIYTKVNGAWEIIGHTRLLRY